MPKAHKPYRSGFASILGRPNAGKSTLLNALVGSKLAIVSDKPQTTRTSIQGVMTTKGGQVVFIDTPGVHRSETLFNRHMMETVRASLADRDLLLFLTDGSTSWNDEDQAALEMLAGVEGLAYAVVNKVDRIEDKRYLLPLLERLATTQRFAEYFPVSAKTSEGLENLRAAVIAAMPEGPRLFPEDYLTDQPERFLAAELIRERILLDTRQEVPHSVAVVVDHWEDKPKLVRIAATIYVERPGQKAIVIGAKGAMLKAIGTAARGEIERLLDKKVFLELFVKVRQDWRENQQFLTALDWRRMYGTGTPEVDEPAGPEGQSKEYPETP